MPRRKRKWRGRRPHRILSLVTFHLSLRPKAAAVRPLRGRESGSLGELAPPWSGREVEEMGRGWEAAPPEVARKFCRKSCGASGGAASCRDGMGMAEGAIFKPRFSFSSRGLYSRIVLAEYNPGFLVAVFH